MVIYGWVHVTSPPKSVADFEGDKVSEEKTVFPISLVEIESKVKKRREGPKEVKKEDMPQESREIVSIPPQPSLSGGESESKEEEKSAENALHNSRTPGKVGEEVVTEQDPNLAKELVP